MYIIAGLGNPSKQYEGTRHNIGFDTIDYLAEKYHILSSGMKHKAVLGTGMIASRKVLLAKPLTYMNLSGESVEELISYYKTDPEDQLIVIYDDINLEPGAIRIRKKGSAGGHNGIKSIIKCTGTQNFKRIRVGVGEKPEHWDLADFVLSRFSKKERELVDEAVGHAADALELILQDNIDGAMNKYNKKMPDPHKDVTGGNVGL